MKTKKVDIAVIGGGPAGMAAAIAAKKAGIEQVVMLEQQDFLGGVLPQCIHDGFGLHLFGRNMTGPEYAAYYRKLVNELGIEHHLSATVMEINKKREVTCVGKSLGAVKIKAEAVILAMGCRERARGALRIPGTRPAGIYTAGAAQHMINIQNYMPGKSIVILGLGDIGLIMARRMTLEGAKVKLVLGLEANGLQRNMVQCIRDFDIPLMQGYTVVSLHGVKRLKGVTIAGLDRDGNVLGGSRRYVPCDTLLLAAGLAPELDIAANAGTDGIFACGNVSVVHDLVDDVTLDGEKAGLSAAAFVKAKKGENFSILNEPERKIRNGSREPKGCPDLPADTDRVKYRICTLCPKGCLLKGELEGSWRISGNLCDRGLEYGLQEILNPMRAVTTTVKIKEGSRYLLPVKTEVPIPKERIMDVMKVCRRITVDKPIRIGSIIVKNIAGTGVDLISCDEVL